MRKSLKIVIGMVVIAAVIGIAWTHTNDLYERSFTAEYRYQVDADLDSGAGINNVTLYVPLPRDGRNISIENISGPRDWELSTVEIIHGRMLEISAERIEPAHRSTLSPLEPGEEPRNGSPHQTPQLNRITGTIASNKEINTVSPQGNEPLLQPKYDLTTTECRFPHGEDQQLNCYEYRSMVFLNYGSESNIPDVLTVSVSFEGSNSWWIYGWNGNEYRDRVYLTVEGEKGWLDAEGKLATGWGSYR